MPRPFARQRGMVLIMVMGTIFLVALLAGTLLSIVNSQSRLTHHQVSRIQAYYAAQAGINYTLEQLRLGKWQAGDTHKLCRSGCEVEDQSFPAVIKEIVITIGALGSGVKDTLPVKAKVIYTYTP